MHIIAYFEDFDLINAYFRDFDEKYACNIQFLGKLYIKETKKLKKKFQTKYYFVIQVLIKKMFYISKPDKKKLCLLPLLLYQKFHTINFFMFEACFFVWICTSLCF